MYYASLCIRDIEYGQGRTNIYFLRSPRRWRCYISAMSLRIPLQQCIPEFLLSISPIHGGIDNREDLIQTIYRMTDDGHAADLAPFYIRWFTLSPRQWREFTAQFGEQGQIYARFVAETALCCGRGGIKAWDYVRMGFLCRMGVVESMADGRGKPVAANRVSMRGRTIFTTVGRNILPPIRWVGCTGRLKGTPYRHISLT